MLTVWRKSWEPFRTYQLTSIANPAQFSKLWLWLHGTYIWWSRQCDRTTNYCTYLLQQGQKNRGEELRKISFGWPGNESSGWAKNRAVINRPKSLHLILRHKKIHSDLSYTLKAWLIIFIKFWNCSYLWYLGNVTTEKMSLHTAKSDVGIEEFLLRENFASNTLSPSLVHCLSEKIIP